LSLIDRSFYPSKPDLLDQLIALARTSIIASLLCQLRCQVFNFPNKKKQKNCLNKDISQLGQALKQAFFAKQSMSRSQFIFFWKKKQKKRTQRNTKQDNQLWQAPSTKESLLCQKYKSRSSFILKFRKKTKNTEKPARASIEACRPFRNSVTSLNISNWKENRNQDKASEEQSKSHLFGRLVATQPCEKRSKKEQEFNFYFAKQVFAELILWTLSEIIVREVNRCGEEGRIERRKKNKKNKNMVWHSEPGGRHTLRRLTSSNHGTGVNKAVLL
jgi:hypothetical protein